MIKRSITVESPDGARVSIWLDDEGGITLCGSAPKELRSNEDRCAQQLCDTFVDAVIAFFPNCELVDAGEGQQP